MAKIKKNKPKRVTVELEEYEHLLLKKLQKDLEGQSGKRTSITALIQGCIRTAIHRVYGTDYVYEQLLDGETFKDWVERS